MVLINNVVGGLVLLIRVIIVVLISIVCIAVMQCLKAAGRADKW